MKTKYIKQILTVAAASAVLSVSALAVQAEECVTQYGGSQYGTSCNPNDLVINKEVQKLGVHDDNYQQVYVENLSMEDNKLEPGKNMTFRLTIKNNSNQEFDRVQVKDIFPPYMRYISGGPSGTVYDAQSRTMTAYLDDLMPGESRVLILLAQAEQENSFPVDKASFCVVNTAQVSKDNRFDEDTAQVCLKTPDVKGATTLPKAGFNDIAMLLPFALLGITGIGLAASKRT